MLTYDNNPSAKIYSTTCAVLGLPLALSYHIAYVKLASTFDKHQQRRMSGASIMSGGNGTERGTAALAVRMAEMYLNIGRTEEAVQLVDETIAVFKKGSSSIGLQNEGRVEVSAGFTVNDVKDLDGDELQMIIQLLRLKGNALMKLKGPVGFAMSAKLNIDALKNLRDMPCI